MLCVLDWLLFLIDERVEVNVGDRFVRQAEQEGVLYCQLQAGQLLAAGAGHHDGGLVHQVDHQLGAVDDRQVVHRRGLQRPLGPDLATGSALQCADHTPRKSSCHFDTTKVQKKGVDKKLDSCLSVTMTTVSMAALDSMTTWWTYKRLRGRPSLLQSSQPPSLYLFRGFKPCELLYIISIH